MGWNWPVWKINPFVCCRGRDKLFLKRKGGDFWSSRNGQAAPGQPSLTKVNLILLKKGNDTLPFALEMDFPLAERKVLPIHLAGPAEHVKEMHPNKSRGAS